MNLCFPVTEDKGLESSVSGHFGSAPLYLIVDTDSGQCRAVPNHSHHHGHGSCTPLASLGGENLEGVVVGGIGRGALGKLRAAKVKVYVSEHPTVGASVAAFKAGSMREVDPRTACGHHGQGSHGFQQGPSHQGACQSGRRNEP